MNIKDEKLKEVIVKYHKPDIEEIDLDSICAEIKEVVSKEIVRLLPLFPEYTKSSTRKEIEHIVEQRVRLTDRYIVEEYGRGN